MIHLTIPTPTDFVFHTTVKSHGWYRLAPYQYDLEKEILTRPFKISDGTIATLHIQGSKSRSLIVSVSGCPILSSRDRNDISVAISHMFNLNQNLAAFYSKMAKTDGYEWINEKKSARMLASPTVWEDLAKTLLTTNTSWSNTEKMAQNLSSIDPDGIFPSPEQIAVLSESELKNRAGTGYRTSYLYQLACRIAQGEINVEQWRDLDSDSLYKAITDLQGFGDYAAGTIMRLLGHFDKLAIDTVARKAYEYVTGHTPESDTDIRDYYEQFGDWRGLVLWMDCIRDEEEDAPQPLIKA